MAPIKITGTLIKNYFHCKRQAKLYSLGINFQSEITKKAEISHKEKNEKEFYFEYLGIKLDNIDFKNSKILEYKKSSSNIEGSKFQVLFYLKKLKEVGIYFYGEIIDLDFDKKYEIKLNEKNEKELKSKLLEIEEFLKEEKILKAKNIKGCNKCSFYNYCFGD
jgi:CRISPR-associated exonuclease Cas4